MSQIFKDDKVFPVTEIQAGPCLVTQIKTNGKDGYESVQVGFDQKNKSNQAERGRFKKIGDKNAKISRYLKEFRTSGSDLKIGDLIKVDIFQPGDKVKIAGFSKGRGFQGVVKRHHFHGSPATHGHKDQLRMPGSIGAGGPAKVLKGQRMPGRMGYKRITVKNLEIIDVKPEKNLLLVRGAVPGSRSGLLEIVTA